MIYKHLSSYQHPRQKLSRRAYGDIADSFRFKHIFVAHSDQIHNRRQSAYPKQRIAHTPYHSVYVRRGAFRVKEEGRAYVEYPRVNGRAVRMHRFGVQILVIREHINLIIPHILQRISIRRIKVRQIAYYINQHRYYQKHRNTEQQRKR